MLGFVYTIDFMMLSCTCIILMLKVVLIESNFLVHKYNCWLDNIVQQIWCSWEKYLFFSIFFLRARLKNIKFGFYSIKHGELSKMGHALKKHLFRFALNTALTPTSEVLWIIWLEIIVQWTVEVSKVGVIKKQGNNCYKWYL